MYCKKCGKKLSDSARFCDRCGQPYGTAPRDGTEINSRTRKRPPDVNRRPDSYDRYRKRKLQKEAEQKRRNRKTRIILVWVIIIAILGSIGGGLYAYYYTISHLNGDIAGVPTPTETQQTAATEKPTTATQSESPDANSSGCEIYIDSLYGFKCPYPSEFETGTLSNKNTRLSMKDPEGDGEMLISFEKISETQTAAVLMRDYVKGLGVAVDFNLAGDNWYEVTFTRNGKVNHRKVVIIDKIQYVYYDFSYNENTPNEKEYKSYIAYADEYLDKQYTTKNENDEND